MSAALNADERKMLERLSRWYDTFITAILNERGPTWESIPGERLAQIREEVHERTRTRTIYISGPMTGMPDFNYPAFHAAADKWRAAGWEVLNPAENFEGRTDKQYHEYIREDIKMLQRADAIALLPGWVDSKGARYELLTAQLLNLDVYDSVSMAPLRKTTRVVTSVPWIEGV